jgi:Tol biopolymer transport system component
MKGVAELDVAYSAPRRLVCRRFADERTAGDIYTVALGRSTPGKLIATPRDEAQPRLSPHGKTILCDTGYTEPTQTPGWQSRAPTALKPSPCSSPSRATP